MVLAYILYSEILLEGKVGGSYTSLTLGSSSARAMIILGPKMSSMWFMVVYLDM